MHCRLLGTSPSPARKNSGQPYSDIVKFHSKFDGASSRRPLMISHCSYTAMRVQNRRALAQEVRCFSKFKAKKFVFVFFISRVLLTFSYKASFMHTTAHICVNECNSSVFEYRLTLTASRLGQFGREPYCSGMTPYDVLLRTGSMICHPVVTADDLPCDLL